MRRETKRLILWVGRLITLFIYAVFLAYAVIVGIAFVLQLLGANPEADFAEWIYRAAANITEPFRGIFPSTEVTDRSTFNASLLFALIVYLVVAVILHGIVDWRERMQAAFQAQQDSTSSALGLDTTPVVTTPTATPAPAWNDPITGVPVESVPPPPRPGDPTYPPLP